MATRKGGISIVMFILVILIVLAVSLWIVGSVQAGLTKKSKDIIENKAFKESRRAYLIQTRDLPDIKLDSFPLRASCRSPKIGDPESASGGSVMSDGVMESQAVVSNVGESGISGADVAVCGENSQIAYWNGASFSTYGGEDNFDFYPAPPTDIEANERSSVPFVARLWTCPAKFMFTPRACTSGVEELDEENNYLVDSAGRPRRIECGPSKFASDITEVTSTLSGQPILTEHKRGEIGPCMVNSGSTGMSAQTGQVYCTYECHYVT